MTSLALFAVAASLGQKPVLVRFVPPAASPFLTSNPVVSSPDSDKPGIVIFRDPQVSDELHKSLKKKLLDSPIISVIRKVSREKFETNPTFDLAAYRKKHNWSDVIWNKHNGSEELPKPKEDYFDHLKTGDVAILLDQFLTGEAMPMEWHPSQAGIIIDARIQVHVAPDEHDFIDRFVPSITDIGQTKPGYVNVKFTAKIYDFMGTMGRDIGSQYAIDGVTFTVVSHSKLDISRDHPFLAHVRLDGKPGPWRYQFEANWGTEDPLEPIRNQHRPESEKFVMPPQNHAVPSRASKEIIVGGAIPINNWNGIRVLRCTEISGYFSHLKIP